MTDPAPPGARSWFWRESTLLAASLAGLGLGAVLHLASRAEAGDLAWTATAVLGAVASGAWVLSAVRQRLLGVDGGQDLGGDGGAAAAPSTERDFASSQQLPEPVCRHAASRRLAPFVL